MRIRASSRGSRRGSCSEFRTDSPQPFEMAFCCCKLLLFLYIGVTGQHRGKTEALSQLGYLPFAVAFRNNALVAGRLAMQPNSQERRMMRRFDMRLPAVVRLDQENEFHTETQNVSARGVFFYLDRPLPAGTRCDVTLTFPPHITLTDAVRVRFSARVIRVESPLPSSRVGTAAMIEDYEFLRSTGSTDFLSALQREMKVPN